MVSSVFNIAVSGLNAAQSGLSAIANNISNAGSKGYSRQDVVQTASAGVQTRLGYLGNGAELVDIRRAGSDFLNARLNDSLSSESYWTAFSQNVDQIDQVLSDDKNGVSAGLTSFFNSLQDLSTRPSDLAARESVITSAKTAAGRINAVDNAINRVIDGVNTGLTGAIDAVNAITTQLADLNANILNTASSGGKEFSPNDLLDKRDMLIQDLSELVSNVLVQNSDGSFNIYLSNGIPLVNKNKAFSMAEIRDSFDPTTINVGVIQNKGVGDPITVRFDGEDLGAGKIAGLLTARDREVESYRNIIGVIAGQFAQKINDLQLEGFDLNGNAGIPMFEISASLSARSLKNSSQAEVQMQSVNFDKVSANNFQLLQKDGELKYKIVGSSDPYTTLLPTTVGSQTIYAIGSEFTFTMSAPLAEGDEFLIRPTGQAAATIRPMLDGPSQIAAGRVEGAMGDSSNILRMTALQTSTVEVNAFGAKQDLTITSAFNQLVSRVGNRSREILSSVESSTALRESAFAQQQSMVGVNLDEEAASLLKYQQAYQASGQVIAVGKNLFDSLLGILS